MRANKHNTCQHCWRKVVILALIAALSVLSFPLSVYRPSHGFFPQIIVFIYLTRPRGKSFPQG